MCCCETNYDAGISEAHLTITEVVGGRDTVLASGGLAVSRGVVTAGYVDEPCRACSMSLRRLSIQLVSSSGARIHIIAMK